MLTLTPLTLTPPRLTPEEARTAIDFEGITAIIKPSGGKERKTKPHLCLSGETQTFCGRSIADVEFLPVLAEGVILVESSLFPVNLYSAPAFIGCNSCVNGAIYLAKSLGVS
jgi:hypothetical protein